MAQRCPTIGADVAGISEIIDHEENGLLFHPDDPGHLAETLRRIFDNQSEATMLADAGYIKVRQKFSIENVCKQQLAAYDILFRRQSRGIL